MLRLNRIKPHGRSARINSRSSWVGVSPDTPVMNARLAMRRIRPHEALGSRKRALISLDEALRAAGRLEVIANLRRLIHRAERTGKCPIIYALFAEIDALHHQRLRAEHTWILAL